MPRYNSNFENRPKFSVKSTVLQCAHSSIAIVDNQVLSRDTLTQTISLAMHDQVSIQSYPSIEELKEAALNFKLIILHLHGPTPTPFFDCELDALEAFGPIFVMSDLRAWELLSIYRKALGTKICGFISTFDTRPRTFTNAIPFVLNGGILIPREAFVEEPQSIEYTSSLRAKLVSLTKRQLDVFALMQEGKPNKIIAYELGLAPSTIKIHVRAVMTALGARNRTEAVFRGNQA